MKCLVVVICQTRGHKTVWSSFQSNVLQTLGADLALCVSNTETTDAFRENAKYIWEYEDPIDWSDAYDSVQHEMGTSVPWKHVLNIDPGRDSCLFGGIRHPHTIGSGAVLFYYRWRALQNIQRLGLESEYDWFIVTRSDFLYPVQHVPLSLLSQDSVWIPNGENYGGVTDRYLICPSKFIERSIDMLKYILTKPDDFFTNYKRWLHGKGANPETFIAFYLEKQGIPVQFVPYFMYTIRELDEIPNPTQFGGAGTKRYKDTNYSIKYPDEKQAADKLSIETPSDWERYIPQPSAI